MNFSLPAPIARLFDRRADLVITRTLWNELLEGLRSRGGYRRESGAFLLGSGERQRRISSIVFYDEIDPVAFDTGIVVIDGGRIADLWRICRSRGEAVVADVHTHGGEAEMSEADRMHPMMAEPGHLALILPDFAVAPVRLRRSGIYRYLGGFRWERLRPTLMRPVLNIVRG